MDADDQFDEFVINMKLALADAQAKRWLGPLRHGYCFSCSTETMVYDVIAEESPVQPPKCEQCFIDGALAFLESPEAESMIKEFMENGPEETE